MLFDPTGRYLLPLLYDNQPTGPGPGAQDGHLRRPYLPGTVVNRLFGFPRYGTNGLLATGFTAVTSFSEDAQPLTADHKPMVIVVGPP